MYTPEAMVAGWSETLFELVTAWADRGLWESYYMPSYHVVITHPDSDRGRSLIAEAVLNKINNDMPIPF